MSISKMSNTLSVREKLIEIVDAERFKSKPQGDPNTHIIVMKKTGNTLKHYATLPRDRLSVGEQLWGDFVCYAVDLSVRKMQINQEFSTRDRITSVRVLVDLSYRVVNSEMVAIGVDDALQHLQQEIITILRREILRLSIDQISEEYLENILIATDSYLRGLVGIGIVHVRTSADWGDDALKQRKDDAARARQKRIDAEKRKDDQQMELEDIEHINTLLHKLGLNGLPADARLQLLALSRKEAYGQISVLIAQQRNLAQDVMRERLKEEYALLREMIDKGILEDMDLADFGKELMHKYQHMIATEQVLGMPPSIYLGGIPGAALGDGSSSRKTPRLGRNSDIDDTDKS